MSSEINKNTNKSPRILSIQSHTVHGYVGNKASTFPLQCLGLHVDAINSITLSNHPGYSSGFKGKVLEADQLTALIDGLSGNNLLGHDAVLTGYVRSLDLLQGVEAALKKVRSVNPSAIYICDPVLGDNGRFYVPEELAIFYRDVLLPLASVVTPNQFEAEVLSGTTIKTHADALTTCRYFHSRGVRTVVLKGLHFADDSFAMYLSHQESDTPNDITDSSPEQRIHTFRLDLTRISDRTFSGCGDLLSALIAGHLVQRFLQHGSTHSLPLSLLAQSLEETGTLMSAVLQETLELGSKELALIESAELFFKARQILLQEPKENFDLFPTTILSNECYKVHGPICGIIFDMDGTLTEGGAINFAAMYERTGLARSGDILKSIREEITDLDQRRKAHRVVREEELLGAEKCIPRPGLRELLHHLRRERVRVAIATRNCDEAVEHFLKLTDLPRDL